VILVERLLADINAVAGVKGTFLCDADGALVAQALPLPIDETEFLPAALTVLQTIEGLETTRRRKVHELDIVFHDARLVVKNLRVGCLYIVCARNMNVPLLNLTANRTAKKLYEILKEVQPKAPDRPSEALVAEAEAEAEAEPIEAESLEADPRTMLLARAREAIAAAQQQGVYLRLLGGMGVKAICNSSASITLPPERLDIDFAVYGKQRRQLDGALVALGYEPNRRFNAMHGRRRLIYDHPSDGITLDVFVDGLQMCHQLSFANRLELGQLALPPGDLLLSKLQIVHMGEKDLRDIYALMCDHELGHIGDLDKIDADYIASVCADDWGWYKTVNTNIEKTIGLVDDFLEDPEKATFTSRALRLREIIEAVPKSLRWQARARIGEAKRWYDLPEE
jgi:predicted regulator of Ras-like GTPase activity (Roadblock/LC7/MglB family)